MTSEAFSITYYCWVIVGMVDVTVNTELAHEKLDNTVITLDEVYLGQFIKTVY